MEGEGKGSTLNPTLFNVRRRSHEKRKMRRRKVLLETGVLLPWPGQKTKRRKEKSVRVKDEEWAGVKMADDGIDV